jgi:HD-like signal output (HDOD) protein
MQEALRDQAAISAVEQRILGFTHAKSGRVVAELWRLPVEVSEVIEFHHHPEDQKTSNQLSVIVQVADRLCWNSGLGYGYSVPEYELFSKEDTWRVLSEKFPKANRFTGAGYRPMLEANLAAAHELAEHVFGTTRALQ